MSRSQKISETAKELMRFRTTHDLEEFGNAIEYVRDYFKGLGVEIEEYESEGFRSIIVHRGQPFEPSLLLHGHLDVVEAEEDMFEPEICDGKLYGRGSADMKAGVACIMDVMRRTDNGEVSLMLVTDEEIGGFNGAGYLIDDMDPDFAISAEPNNTSGYLDIVTKQKGVLQVDVSMEGSSGHASRPWKGDNAAEKLIEKYPKIRHLFEDYSDNHWVTTCNLGTMESGKSRNRIPDSATFGLDVRFTSEYDSSDVVSDLKAIEGLSVDVKADEPMLDTDESDESVQKLHSIAKGHIGNSGIVRKEPASDMRFFSGKGIPAVVFGPEGYNSHAGDEHAVVSSFSDYCEILEKFIEEM